jgi:hypothetical protein
MTQVREHSPLDRWYATLLVAGISPLEAIRVIHAVARDMETEQEARRAA